MVSFDIQLLKYPVVILSEYNRLHTAREDFLENKEKTILYKGKFS